VVVGSGIIDLPVAGGNLANVGDVVFNFSGSGFSWTDSDIAILVWSQADMDLVLSLTVETNSLCGPGSDCENRIVDLHVNDGSFSGVDGGYQCRVGALLCDPIFINAGAVTTATRVVEPATIALLGLGLAGVGYERCKQIKVAQDFREKGFPVRIWTGLTSVRKNCGSTWVTCLGND